MNTQILKPLALLIVAVALSGCFYDKRPKVTQQQLLQRRVDADQRSLDNSRQIGQRVLERTRAQYDDYTAHRRASPPVIDILIISCGGDWGAFGAGFLKGWRTVPATDPLAKPDFTAVTGVSTGALIAPFAFVDDDESIDRIDALYRNPKKDW
jgi:hypothetical protein